MKPMVRWIFDWVNLRQDLLFTSLNGYDQGQIIFGQNTLELQRIKSTVKFSHEAAKVTKKKGEIFVSLVFV